MATVSADTPAEVRIPPLSEAVKPCDLYADECAVQHVMKALPGRASRSRKRRIDGQDDVDVPYQFSLACPLCIRPKVMTLTVEDGKILAFCHRCKAPQPELMTALARRTGCARFVPSPPRTVRRPVKPADIDLLAGIRMPPKAKMLALLELSGMTTTDALDFLGVGRSHRYKVITGRDEALLPNRNWLERQQGAPAIVRTIKRTALYRLYDDAGVLLYVGITDDLCGRMRGHETMQPWWPQVRRKTVAWYDERDEADLAETMAIAAERPLHNQAKLYNPKESVEF